MKLWSKVFLYKFVIKIKKILYIYVNYTHTKNFKSVNIIIKLKLKLITNIKIMKILIFSEFSYLKIFKFFDDYHLFLVSTDFNKIFNIYIININLYYILLI